MSSNPDNGIPIKRVVTLAYGTSCPLNGGAFTYAANLFRLNGLYDPDATGAGHQPRGYDQLLSSTGPYTRYTVTHCEVTVVFKNGTADNVFCGLLASNYASSTADVATIDDVLERSNIIWKPLMPTGSTGQFTTIKTTYDIGQFLGRPNILSDDDLAGAYNANPSIQCYVLAFMISHTIAPVLAYADVQLKYTTTLHARATPASS
jgi:hypothetical protein